MRCRDQRVGHLKWARICLAAYALFLFRAVPVLGEEIPYLSLKTVAARLGMEIEESGQPREARLASKWTALTFEEHQRDFLLNGTRVFLGFPVALKDRRLAIAEADFVQTLQPILTPQVFSPPGNPIRVILDAGHGGHDPGARNASLGLQEKDLVLRFSGILATHLRAAGFEVGFTREDDHFIELEERSRLANASGADVFLSLHFNASYKPGVTGAETFVLPPAMAPPTSRAALSESDRQRYPGNGQDPWNLLLGFYVQRQLHETMAMKDRGLKRARFVVLRDLQMPGILIEGGFLSNETEARQLAKPENMEKLAEAITTGLITYRRTVDRLFPETDTP